MRALEIRVLCLQNNRLSKFCLIQMAINMAEHWHKIDQYLVSI